MQYNGHTHLNTGTLARASCAARRLIARVLWAGVAGVCVAGQPRPTPLLEDLQQRTANEGLGLVCVRNNWVWNATFGVSLGLIRNPRVLSSAWFSPDGSFVAWTISGYREEYSLPVACRSALVVDALDGSQKWQLPGRIAGVRAISISADGRRLAFFGTYKPPGTAFKKSPENRARWITGLQYTHFETGTITLVPQSSELDVTSISWAPDGSAFVYDSQNRVYIYNIQTNSQKLIAEGATPAWSPDGKWIGFRSITGKAAILNLNTNETKVLLHGHKITWGVHWSPDSRYIMVGVMKNYLLDVLQNPLDDRTARMVIYRLEDGASVSGEWFAGAGIDDQGYYWVKDYRVFLKGAAVQPTISPCDDPGSANRNSEH